MIATASSKVLVADECWIALSLLHRAHPERVSFSAREILDRLKLEKVVPEVRAGVHPHIYMHNVANLAPVSGRYRMFYRLDDGTYRLFRPGDDFHPLRTGKTVPERDALPEGYHQLLDWYENQYSRAKQPAENGDPVLQMRGIGKEIWKEGADAFVTREREGWDEMGGQTNPPVESPKDRVWKRIVAHQGGEFRTVRGKPFTYTVEGKSGIRPRRHGKDVNHQLSRGDIERAISRCPLDSPSEIKDCRGSSYLYGLLMDRRIRDNDW